MKIAIVHDWLVVSGGAEKVLQRITECFPSADIFTLVDFLEDRQFLDNHRVQASFIQKMPFAKKHYRNYIALMPLAIEQFDLSEYDLIISSSYAVAKGVLTGPDQLHISYMHSPIRYAWDLQHQYLREAGLAKGLKTIVARALLHYIRGWDARSTNGVDHLIANSRFIARRIKKAYRRDAAVIHPPVDVNALHMKTQKDEFYLTASRMVPYKRIDMIVKAFSMTPERRLIVIGDGPDMRKVRAAAGPNVTIMGYQSFEVLRDHLQRARAFVYAAEEDFGISIIEAQACGTPVITYGKGGALETVIGIQAEHPTGIFFKEQTPAALNEAVSNFERHAHRFNAQACRENAEKFSAGRFKESLIEFVQTHYGRFQLETAPPPAYAGYRGTDSVVVDSESIVTAE